MGPDPTVSVDQGTISVNANSILDVLSKLLANRNSLKLPQTANCKEHTAPTSPETVFAEQMGFERWISKGKSFVNFGG